jgi:hypothetical protein
LMREEFDSFLEMFPQIVWLKFTLSVSV